MGIQMQLIFRRKPEHRDEGGSGKLVLLRILIVLDWEGPMSVVFIFQSTRCKILMRAQSLRHTYTHVRKTQASVVSSVGTF